MRFLVKMLLILAFGYLAGLYFPFWSLVIVAFIMSLLIKTSPLSSFLAGFLAIFALWFVLASSIDQETNSILTTRVASIFSVSNVVLMLITGAIGGFITGLGSASGALLVRVKKKKRRSKYH